MAQSSARQKQISMSQNDYSKREIDILFGEIKDQLNRIEDQCKRTNGSIINLKLWKSYVTGGLAILAALVLPVLGYLAFTVVNVDKQVSAHIEATK